MFGIKLNRLAIERRILDPELVVSKEYRRQGIGKILVHKCETIAKRNKRYRIRLESRNDRIDSHDFYRKIGGIAYLDYV